VCELRDHIFLTKEIMGLKAHAAVPNDVKTVGSLLNNTCS
jgi:hypothetical protein